MIDYIIDSTIVFTVLFITYYLLLRNSKSHKLNRIILLSIPLLSLIIPLIQFSLEKELAPVYLDVIIVGKSNVAESIIEVVQVNWINVIYILGVVFFIGIGAFNVFRILTNRVKNATGYSFFNKIYVNPSLDKELKEVVLKHEQIHASQWHSADVIVYYIYKAVFWFNPLIFLASKEIKVLHEYQVDEEMNHVNEHYQKQLVAQSFGVSTALLTNNFSKSNLKKRIVMMNKEKNKKSKLKYLVLIPALGLTLTLSSWNVVNEIIIKKEQKSLVGEVDKPAEFPGGTDALMKYMSTQIKYPKESKDQGVEGRVFVGFVIDKNGSIKKVVLKKGTESKELNDEAIRVVKSMPKWSPAIKDGKKVASEMVLPIMFKLEG